MIVFKTMGQLMLLYHLLIVELERFQVWYLKCSGSLDALVFGNPHSVQRTGRSEFMGTPMSSSEYSWARSFLRERLAANHSLAVVIGSKYVVDEGRGPVKVGYGRLEIPLVVAVRLIATLVGLWIALNCAQETTFGGGASTVVAHLLCCLPALWVWDIHICAPRRALATAPARSATIARITTKQLRH